MNILIALLAFFVTIFILVTFHEFGHFWVARRCGVHVQRFSIGFGPVLFSRQDRHGTEFAFSAIPLGGYVKMLGEQPDDEIDEADQAGSFKHKSLGQRAAIVAAGPIANLILAVAVYWLLSVVGVTAIRAIVDQPPAGTLAQQAGFQLGDQVTEVNGKRVLSWEKINGEILQSALSQRDLLLAVRSTDGSERELSLNVANTNIDDPERLFDQVGLYPLEDATVTIRELLAGGAGGKAGLQVGDKILRVNDVKLRGPRDFMQQIESNPGRVVDIVVERAGQLLQLSATPASLLENGKHCGKLGVAIGAQANNADRMRTHVRFGPIEAIGEAVVKTVEKVQLTVTFIWRMLNGSMSAKHISGPITIADVAGQTIQIGFASFLSFLALLSISIAILNLLPVPVLDGGHLLLFFIEWIKGGELTERVRGIAQGTGLVMVGALMVLAITNDVGRLTAEPTGLSCHWGISEQ